MCEHGTSVVLPTPEWLWGERAAPENGIAIDACIADTVEALWELSVFTLGSCCGHGESRPSLVLNGDTDMPERATAVLAEVDARDWQLYQWQLVDVTEQTR